VEKETGTKALEVPYNAAVKRIIAEKPERFA